MKETIYTIPINEAFEADSFCPFCHMKDQLEKEAVSYTVGPAMMESDFRMITNELGFCQKHIRELGAKCKALPLSLVFESHLSHIEELFDTDLSSGKKGVFSKKDNQKEIFAGNLQKLCSSCAVCSRVDTIFSHYVKSFFYMLKTEKDFLQKVLNSQGFCIEHFSLLASSAQKELSDSQYKKLFLPIAELEKKRINDIHTHISTFSQSFDYRNIGKKNDVPKDILHLTSKLLCGSFAPKDKELDDI